MRKLTEIFSRQKQILDQKKQIKELSAELESLRSKNESMKQGMRRCTSCDYRLDYKTRQGRKK